PSLLVDTIYRFVSKGQSQATVEEAFARSRGLGIEGQWETFSANPLFGIGFGVSLDSSFKPVLDSFTGLPLSAPVEKGFLPTAVLEETGIFGTTFFILFVFSLTRHVFSKTEILLPWVFMASLVANVGE